MKSISPVRTLTLLMTYALGAGLVQYVDSIRDVTVMIGGGVFLLMVLLALDYLRSLPALSKFNQNHVNAEPKQYRFYRLAVGLIAALFLTVAIALYIGWLVSGVLWQGMNLIMIVVVVSGGFYYMTSARLKLMPYQLLVEALLVVVIPPAMGFFLQSQTAHPFLTPVVLGLVPLYLAYRLLEMLKSFYEDQQQGRRTLVVAIGWERAMVLHNVLILLGYVILALVTLLGFPWRLLWPVFLTLPIGLLEIWLMERTRQGRKPLWRVMRIAAASVLVIPIYLIAFAFWIR
ncbi:MAG: hypothetical protein SVR81_00350 [Chloroflexota bacterium]|nr:hypothetical protein [Chloroflexota bacterium]